ncbi:hypothetical protein HWV62_43772 [Athelia sp. TMB]|nr:hypothetical protein HWV62_43772 [Athelia sp. TMB]
MSHTRPVLGEDRRAAIAIDAEMEINEVPGVQLEGERSSPMEHYKASGIKPTINTFGVSGHANMVNIAGDHITNISNEKEKEYAKEVYDWLAAPDVSQNYNAARRKHLENTGSWFLNDMAFSEWKRRPEQILCIYGAPYRHGKIPEVLRDMYQSHGSGRESPSIKSLRDTLQRVVNDYDHFYIMIDSVDECGDRAELLDWIQSFASGNVERIHLLFTSRPEPDITNRLSLITHIRLVNIQGQTVRRDIADFVDKRLLLLSKWNKVLKELVKTTLVDGADGMFRWVALQVDELKRCLNPKDVKKQLKILPRTLEETYDRILTNSEHQENLLQMLHWLTFSVRDIRLAELADVVSVDLHADGGPCYDPELKYGDDLAALAVCSGLVTEALGIVKLSHFSVKEYLISERTKAGTTVLFAINKQISHSVIVQTCLAYLLSFDKNESIVEENIHLFPLALYAAQCWFHHYRSIDHPESSPVRILVSKLFSPSTYAMVNWVRLRAPDAINLEQRQPNLKLRATDVAQPLYYASLLGLKHIAEGLLDTGAVVDSRGGTLGTPLIAAVQGGQMEVVQLLLSQGADVNLQAGSPVTPSWAPSEQIRFGARVLFDYGEEVILGGGVTNTPLSIGSFEGHIDIVKLLLERGADVSITSHRSMTALYMASFRGHVELARLLLEHGAEVDSLDVEGETALSEAVCGGHTEFVRLLLEHSADVSISNSYGMSALFRASDNVLSGIAKLLLEHGADIDSRDTEGDTPLSNAAYRGHIDLVKLLLSQGPDVNHTNNNGRTAFQRALANSNIDIAKLLLEHGADINSRDMSGETALSEAAYGSHIKLIKFLLEHGADVNITDNDGVTALQTASCWGNIKTARLLLEHGADIDSRGMEGDTALFQATDACYIELVNLLLEHGADANIANNDNRTALHAASYWGRIPIARLLLEFGADIHSRDMRGDTALSEAAYRGHTGLVMLLLGQGVDVNIINNDSRTALHRASYQGHIEIARLLLEHGADIHSRDIEEDTPLSDAAYGGHTEMATLLLEHGARTEQGYPALHRASSRGHTEVARLLLNHGASIHSHYKEGNTPLSSGGHIEVVKLLLDRGADVEIQDETGRTALQRASLEGHAEVVGLLREHAVDVDVRDKDGQTALSHASSEDRDGPSKLLMTRVVVQSRDGAIWDAGSREESQETGVVDDSSEEDDDAVYYDLDSGEE